MREVRERRGKTDEGGRKEGRKGGKERSVSQSVRADHSAPRKTSAKVRGGGEVDPPPPTTTTFDRPRCEGREPLHAAQGRSVASLHARRSMLYQICKGKAEEKDSVTNPCTTTTTASIANSKIGWVNLASPPTTIIVTVLPTFLKS